MSKIPVNDPSHWSVTEVCKWANGSKYKIDTISALASNEVDGKLLLSLSQRDLREELGIKSLPDRKRLYSDIIVLNARKQIKMETYKSDEYFEVKQTVEAVVEEGGIDSISSKVLDLQLEEVKAYESRVADHELATITQEYFNYLLQKDESDASIAIELNNINDRAAAVILRRQADLEAATERENESLIMEQTKSFLDENGSKEVAEENEDQSTAVVVPHLLQPNSLLRECIVCGINIYPQVQSLECGHHYCDSCLRDWLNNAELDKSLLPLKCCKTMVALDKVKLWGDRLIGSERIDQLIDYTNEAICEEKMYCPNIRCSQFIDLDKVLLLLDADMNFLCSNPKCKLPICFKCHNAKHESTAPCVKGSPMGDQLRAFGYQQCKSCYIFVELSYGCNHMTCRCGFEFCYLCGGKWKDDYGVRMCNCILFDVGRLRLEEARHLPEGLVGAAREAQLNARVHERAREMHEEEACRHNYRRTDEFEFRSYKPKCRDCYRRLNLFGYQCDFCNRRRCIGCQLHR